MTVANTWLIAAMVGTVGFGLYFVDRELALVESKELAAEAQSWFERAQRASSENRMDEAVELYRHALTLERSSREYQLALSRALVKTGRREEAAPLLTTVLSRGPNYGPANLEMARLLKAGGDTTGAAAYYHRAIYGTWPSGADAEILHARLELVDMLEGAHQNRDVLAELLLLEDSAHRDPEILLKVARWYLSAGFPARAATLFREFTKTEPDNPEVYAGLGDAELTVGDYRSAREAYTAAMRRGDKSVSERLVTAVELASLDPTVRRLGSAERKRRSDLILARAEGMLGKCVPNPDLQARAEQKQSDPDEAVALAEEIWAYGQRACPDIAQADAPMTTLMSRLNERP